MHIRSHISTRSKEDLRFKHKGARLSVYFQITMALFTLHHLGSKMSCDNINQLNRIQHLGNFPRKHYHYQRNEEPGLKDAIKRLCQKETGYMAVVGQGGTGKSALVAKILQSEQFLPVDCPSIQTVIWLNVMKFSSKKIDASGFFFALAKLMKIKLRKPEGQNDKTLEEQLRDALISRRAKPASILLVLDDVYSDEILPLLARFQYIIRSIAISRFGATFGVHGENSTYAPIVFNVQPMSDDECVEMMTELLPEDLLPKEKVTALAKHCAGLPLVGRLICGHFFGCDARTASVKFDELNDKLASLKAPRHAATQTRKVQDIVPKLLELHFERDDAMFARFCAFLLFEEEEGVEAEDLSFLWNVDVKEAVNYCEHQLCGKGIVQLVNFDGESEYNDLQGDEEAIMDTDESIACHSIHRHCYTVHSILYQAAVDLQKKHREKENIQLSTIIKEAGRRHPKAWLGENILHVAARLKRTNLLRTIVDRADVDCLYALCTEENADKVTPTKFLCAAYAGDWFVDAAPPLVKATLPLLDKLSATPLTDSVLEQIIASKCNVDALLILSCDIGYSFLAAKLIFKARANVNARKRRWPYYNCLMLAARKGHDTIAKLLLDNSADAAAKDGHGRTALMLAVEMGREAVVSSLLEKGADLLEDGNVMPALMLALEKKQENIAKLLLMKGAEQNIAEDLSERALILAARSCREPMVVKFLLEKGADPNSKDVLNRTALIQATLNGLETNVRLLLSYGAQPDVRDKEKQTSLLIAAQLGHEEIVKVLLENNANVNAKDRLDRTALIIASWKGHDSIVGILLDNGADPNSKDWMGRTALLLASENGREATVSMLLEKGADIKATDKVYSRTPLMLAAANGHWTTVRILIEKGAAPNESETFNRSNALLLATENGHTAVVELLLQKGVDPNFTNAFLTTALMLAARQGHEGLLKILLERGANPKAKDRFNRTALDIGKAHSGIAKLLIPVTN